MRLIIIRNIRAKRSYQAFSQHLLVAVTYPSQLRLFPMIYALTRSAELGEFYACQSFSQLVEVLRL